MASVLESIRAALSGSYRVERELGRGGMATVFLAEDLKHGRPVAIKVLDPRIAATIGPDRFLREIQHTARLQHPHVLGLIDSGEAADLIYYVMPYVSGESLRARLNRERQLPLDEVERLTTEIAAGLGHAHAQGLVHRDIKPENVLLSDGHAMIADLGIARAVSEAGIARLTETGLIIGTPEYMSPEQAAGDRDIDSRSDIYALGCVVYEMLAGHPPFTGSNPREIIARHTLDPVPRLRSARVGLPEGVEAVIQRALAKSPADRFASAEEFAGALASGQAGRAQAARLPLRPLLWAGAGAVVVAAGVWGFRQVRETVLPAAATIAILPLAPTAPDTQLTRLGFDLAGTISASLDGLADLKTVDRLTIQAQTSGRDHPLDLREGAALGRRFGARSVAWGTLTRDGAAVRVDLRLYETDSLAPITPPIVLTAPAESISLVTDSVTRVLLSLVWRRGETPSPSLEGAFRTRSLPALRAFLDGERLLVEGRMPDAAREYEAAFRADPTFWLASFRYKYVSSWSGLEADSTIANAHLRHRFELPEVDRLMVEAGMALQDSLTVSLARSREAVARAPANWFAWFDLGDTYVHFGPLLGPARTEARAALERAVALNPRLIDAWQHLGWMYLQDRDTTAALRHYTELARLGANPALSADWNGSDYLLQLRYLLTLERTGGAPTALVDSVAREYAVHGPSVPITPGWYGFGQGQLDVCRAMIRYHPSPAMIEEALRWEPRIWSSRGAWDSALVAVDRWRKQIPDDSLRAAATLQGYWLAVMGAFVGAVDTAEARRRRDPASVAVQRLKPNDRARFAWLDGILSFVGKDRAGIARARGSLSHVRDSSADLWDESLAAFEIGLGGDTRRAGQLLASLESRRAETPDRAYGNHPLTALDRLAASRWLLEAGDTAQATRLLFWPDGYAGGVSGFILYPLMFLERAQIAEAQGQVEEARKDYQQFLSRYDRPPPAHKQLVLDAEEAMRRLSGLAEPAQPR
jgi:tetratricopeptide (TPR) repeat protein